jgi:hypothetical protein
MWTGKNMTNMHTPSPSVWQLLADNSLTDQPDAEQQALDYMITAVQILNLSQVDMDHLKPAVTEAVLNIIEHGNRHRTDCLSFIQLRIFYQAGAGQDTSCGWGFFLVEHMVDDRQNTPENHCHTIELFLYPE